MLTADLEKMLEEVTTLVTEDLKMVSYKWIARHFDIPANMAKQLLFKLVEGKRAQVHATYLLSGWLLDPQGLRQHVVQVVAASRLAEEKARLDPITGLHVYSVQPSQPKDPGEVWTSELEQTRELFANLISPDSKPEPNCLANNRCSGVACPAAKRDPGLLRRAPVPAPAPPAAAPAAAGGGKRSGGGPGVGAASGGARSGGGAGVARGPGGRSGGSAAATSDKQPPSSIIAQISAIAGPARGKANSGSGGGGTEAADAGLPPPATSGGRAANAENRTANAPAKPPATAGKKANGIAAMFGRAPPKRKATAPPEVEPEAVPESAAEAAAPPPPPPDSEAMLRAVAETAGRDSDSEEDMQPAPRRAAVPSRRSHMAPLSDSSDENDDFAPRPKAAAPVKAAQKSSGTAGKKRSHALVISDDDSDDDKQEAAADKAPAKKRAAKGAKPTAKPVDVDMAEAEEAGDAAEGEADAQEEEAEKAVGAKGGRGRKAAAPHFGSVKVRDNDGAAEQTKKETRTYINDDGEEVTEVVIVNSAPDTGKGALPPAGSQDSAPPAPPSQQPATSQPKSQREAAARTSPKRPSGGAAKGPAAKGGKKGGKADKGQKGIASYFAKK